MPLSEDDKDVKQRAVDNIMKLINSQISLEKKQAKMDAKVGPGAVQCSLHFCAIQPVI